jgi:molecular chaperone GrpE
LTLRFVATRLLTYNIKAANNLCNAQDKYLRSVADYRNLQERTKRETQAARDFALQKFLKDLFQSVDNLEHALLSVSKETLASPSDASVESLHSDLVNLHQGLQLTERVLLDTLKKQGVTRCDPAKDGEKFDPNRHEAVFQSPMEGKEDGLVFHTQQKGFLLNGRVLRVSIFVTCGVLNRQLTKCLGRTSRSR